MKTGELFALRDPTGDGKKARFENYARGLFQDALSMLAEDDGLYVLHRRNLTKIVETDGVADRFDRVAALPHGIADTYDMAYGLARDKQRPLRLRLRPLRQHDDARLRRRARARARASRRRRSRSGCATRSAGAPGRTARSSSPTTRATGSRRTSSATSREGQLLRLPEPRRSRSTPRSPPARRRSGCRTPGRGRSTASPTTTPAASSARSPGSSSWPS